jgi:hypothetical protein
LSSTPLGAGSSVVVTGGDAFEFCSPVGAAACWSAADAGLSFPAGFSAAPAVRPSPPLPPPSSSETKLASAIPASQQDGDQPRERQHPAAVARRRRPLRREWLGRLGPHDGSLGALEHGQRGGRARRPARRELVAQLVDQRPERGRRPLARRLGEQHAGRVEVRALARRLARPDLGRHVALGPDHLAVLGERGGVGGLGDAEVGQPRVAGGVDQHVVRLDVTVQDAVGVDVAQRREQLAGETFSRRRVAVGEALGEGSALDVLHDQVGPVAGVEVVDLHQVRVLEPGGDPRFAPEAVEELAVAGDGVGEHLDRNLAPEALVRRQPDRGHAAMAERPSQQVATSEPAAGDQQRALGEVPRRGAVRGSHAPTIPRRCGCLTNQGSSSYR